MWGEEQGVALVKYFEAGPRAALSQTIGMLGAYANVLWNSSTEFEN